MVSSLEAAFYMGPLWLCQLVPSISSLVVCFMVSDRANLIMTVIVPMNLIRLLTVLVMVFASLAGLKRDAQSRANRVRRCLRLPLFFVQFLLTSGVLVVSLVVNFSIHRHSGASSSGIILIAVLAMMELVICLNPIRLLFYYFDKAEPAGAAVDFEARAWSSIDAVTYGHQDRCAICLEEYEEGVLIGRTACSHIFHDHCYRTWLGHNKIRQQLCPFRCERTAGHFTMDDSRESVLL
eukprot:TRINITY_DN8851_c0_g1_i1.p1 TRINITY_DN8851_c0_g1~~TRINITY_DN8851_c0_g1_i1.p1  ORF type:complete len:237 (+),score=21.71 TRINITY_DN8851_c0_g1_i1:68-778(+)